jgi:hypothetical protein
MTDITKEPVASTEAEPTVSMPKSELEAMMKRIKRLEETSHKGRLSNYDRMNEKNPTRIYKLRVMNGKVIVAWSDLIVDRVEINPITKKVEEEQKLCLYYEDGKTEDIDIVTFNRRFTYINATIKEEKILHKEEDIKKFGDRKFVLETEDEKEYEVGVKFVN